MINNLSGMLFVVLMLGTTLELASRAERGGHIQSEHRRKLVHVCMGLVTIAFPWIFSSGTPVYLLGAVTATMLFLLKRMPDSFPWKAGLCGNRRRSLGEICFPLAVMMLFFLAHGNRITYCLPLLILTGADALSALVGISYGRRIYHTADGCKTTEGSLVFFLVAFLSTHVALLLATDLARPNTLFVSLIVGIISMLFEGVAWWGLDNLLVPLGAYLTLVTHLHCSLDTLLFRLVSLIIILAALLLAKRKTSLNGSAILAVALYAYFALILGGTAWLAMPVIVFASYNSMLPRRFRNMRSRHSVYPVIAIGSTGLLWLVCAAFLSPERFLVPYTLSFAINEAILAIAHMPSRQLNRARTCMLLKSALKSWALTFIPLVLIEGLNRSTFPILLLAPVCILVPTASFYVSRKPRRALFACTSLDNTRRWLEQTAIVTAGSSVGLVSLLSLAR